MSQTARQKEIQQKGDKLHSFIVDGFVSGRKLAVIKAPPGSGKTFMLLRIIASLVEANWRVAIATQTNTQADDVILQLSKHEILQNFAITRLAAGGSNQPSWFPVNAEWVQKPSDASTSPGVTVGTSAKWATVKDDHGFDLFAIDEAWQMKWADMMRCSAISDKYLLIGDPGQIPPVTSVDVSRWGTSQRPPHMAVPDVVLEKFSSDAMSGSLPAVRRLPAPSVEFVKPFYDFDFEAFAELDERVWQSSSNLRGGLVSKSPKDAVTNAGLAAGTADHDSAVLKLIKSMHSFEPVIATIPTPADGPPADTDREIAVAIRRIVQAFLELDVKLSLEKGLSPRAVEQVDIGISATHRATLGLIRKYLGADYSKIRVDTPERWQGLQKPLMIAVHPLSGAIEPSDFDLQTGRLCVMASRHQIGLIIVTRDHIEETLANTVTFATQAPGMPDETARGRRAHVDFLAALRQKKRFISLI